MEENQEESRTITRNEVKARLEGVKLEDMSAQDLFDRYIVYGTTEELNCTGVQKQLIQYGYLEYLIHIVEKLEVTEAVIEKMKSSQLFKTKGYAIKRGTIEHIEIGKYHWLPDDYVWLIFEVQDENKQDRYTIKYLRVKQKFKTRLKTLRGKPIMAIVEQKNDELFAVCFLVMSGGIGEY